MKQPIFEHKELHSQYANRTREQLYTGIEFRIRTLKKYELGCRFFRERCKQTTIELYRIAREIEHRELEDK